MERLWSLTLKTSRVRRGTIVEWFSLLVLFGCVEPVALSSNETRVDASVDQSFVDARVPMDEAGLVDAELADVVTTDVMEPTVDAGGTPPEAPVCGNGEVEDGEQCDEPGEGCVNCRVVRVGVCESECRSDRNAYLRGLTYVESMTDFSVEGDTHFGASLAVHGRHVVIGAHGTNVADETAAEATGQIYFYEFEDGRINQSYHDEGFLARWPEDGIAGGQFGLSVAISEEMAFVGAPGQPNGARGSGRVSSYRRQNNGLWRAAEFISLLPRFTLGTGLAADDDTVVFNYREEDGGYGVQSYGYLVGEDVAFFPPLGERPTADRIVGEQLGLNGEWMLANVEPDGLDPVVVIYQRNGFGNWDRVRGYRPEGATHPSGYGFSLDSFGSFNVFGAPTDENEGVRCGAVYIIRGSSQSQRLNPEDCAEGDRFGHSVAMVGERLLVGSPGYAGGSGRVFLYTLDGNEWVLDGPPVMDPHGAGTRFGTSVGLGDGFALVGAPRESGVAEDAVGRGRVLVYHFGGFLCFEDDGRCVCADGMDGDECACAIETFDEKDYRFCDQSRAWSVAREACLGEGMDLVVIDHENESEWLKERRRTRFNGPVWIGLQESLDERGTFVWVDGTPVVFSDWRAGEPDNDDAEANCGSLGVSSWRDYRCTREQPFICERPTSSAEAP